MVCCVCCCFFFRSFFLFLDEYFGCSCCYYCSRHRCGCAAYSLACVYISFYFNLCRSFDVGSSVGAGAVDVDASAAVSSPVGFPMFLRLIFPFFCLRFNQHFIWFHVSFYFIHSFFARCILFFLRFFFLRPSRANWIDSLCECFMLRLIYTL